ncbi:MULTISPECIES: MFS transporter [Halomonas]|uniref:MFS transporter n=1 Tax=Halomonas TaxID=2745 RepID=UPI001C9381C6|nr:MULTISPECIES: MFS transporter [Halomonas]MBY6208978.1 MFS transporter [Halomonas sp. DP3Y7-2]MBY6227448.1 MFS transporter [Halomonas sp. DP3Y7-1]MCA0914801.1 MFS transporter [Halomonas denitrificans]
MTRLDATTFTRHQVSVLAIVLTSYLMIVVDISIVITGLPEIKQDLGFSVSGLAWVQTAYTLSFGGLLLLGARAGDLLGRRRMLVAGLGLFTLSSLAIGLAQSTTWMLVGRAIQGSGAAILAPSTLALLSTHFREGSQRHRALAYYASAAGVGSSLGLVLGGVFAGELSWRVGFFINIPIGVALVWAAHQVLEETPKRGGTFDTLGALLSTLGMTALVFAIVRSAQQGWSDGPTLASLTTAGLLLSGFVFNESRVRQPILPLRLFASRQRVGAYLARLLFIGAMLSFFFYITQFLQDVMGFTPLEAGLAFLPVTLPIFLASLLVTRLTHRLGHARLLALALVSTLAGMAWLGLLTPESRYAVDVALPMVLIGVGNGLALGPLTVAGVAGVEERDAGAASGMVNVAHQLGGALGLSVLVVVYSVAGDSPLQGRELLAHQLVSALLGSAGLLAIALAVATLLIVLPSPKPSDQRHCART